ncbi:hypothetical protein MHPYR_710018 [uncultured Mycobacterium sp.]|uniref:Abortive infection protein-like C-terminal domain-containing protein n=1 Tax=uncultured Mycobacterium sp. TaxID=171292 RepID=A0A1Y5PSZ1_9MYCO|nr:hypothetical protein MHPYR_710018 [uncultured Mycobacterium sp.]
MEYQHELYAERLRLKAQAEALATGATQWTQQLNQRVRIRVALAWEDAILGLHYELTDFLDEFIAGRMLRSVGYKVMPEALRRASDVPANEYLLSVIEAQHEALVALVPQIELQVMLRGGLVADYGDRAGDFRRDVNQAFQAHLIGLQLHHNSRLFPIDSHEMHSAVVEPTLYLLHSQPRFASAETAYQNALKELRNRDPGDAITDAATALQEILTALGCEGGALGDLLTSAKKKGLLAGADTPLTESILKTVNWVAAQRNQGEAHRADPGTDMSDAWMVVHVVGALAIRLSETGEGGSS